jgi:DNA invertase Pin-like site-specific DNA recombinase
MVDAGRRKFDAVLTWKLDRFGRSLKHLVVTIAEFESFGVSFISLTDNLDLSTAQGRLMFHVIAAMSEFERSLTQERVRAGLRNARAKGKIVGRPRVAVDSARIASLREQGRSWRDVCAETGLSAGVAKRAFYSLSNNPQESASVIA